MVPQKKDTEIIKLDSLSFKKNNQSKRYYKIDEGIGILEKEEQKRITIYHYVVHVLTFLIIITYMVLIIFKNPIPPSFSTIVSVVIGFYFAKNLI